MVYQGHWCLTSVCSKQMLAYCFAFALSFYLPGFGYIQLPTLWLLREKEKGTKQNKDKSKLILFLRSLEGIHGHIGNKEKQIRMDTQHIQKHEIRFSAALGSTYYATILKSLHFSHVTVPGSAWSHLCVISAKYLQGLNFQKLQNYQKLLVEKVTLLK